MKKIILTSLTILLAGVANASGIGPKAPERIPYEPSGISYDVEMAINYKKNRTEENLRKIYVYRDFFLAQCDSAGGRLHDDIYIPLFTQALNSGNWSELDGIYRQNVTSSLRATSLMFYIYNHNALREPVMECAANGNTVAMELYWQLDICHDSYFVPMSLTHEQLNVLLQHFTCLKNKFEAKTIKAYKVLGILNYENILELLSGISNLPADLFATIKFCVEAEKALAYG
ncbi:hypothetical protein FACS1894113_5120 [Alphaproteobacteria bacterium]|nr:hypothetical protein FACS1894113_5120 [Alphaproteobacteria bacterium]